LATFCQRNSNRCIIVNSTSQPLRPDSLQIVSEIPGAIKN
jgi:hypothetical protein